MSAGALHLPAPTPTHIGPWAGLGVGAGVAAGAGVGVATGAGIGDGDVKGGAVGAASTTGVAVAARVARGVDVGTAVGCGVGVGALVPTGVGAAAGAEAGEGTAVGFGVLLASEASVKTVEANVSPSSMAPEALLFFVPTTAAAIVAAASTVWPPAAPAGTRSVTLSVPRPLIDAMGMPAADLSHVSWTCVLEANPVPVTVTDVPAVPTAGESEILGAESVAKLEENGATSAAATRRIKDVAAQSRQRELLDGWGVAATSETHRVPSQKANTCSIRRPG